MADSNYSNAADRNDLTQDDPFAELTRIMGHNPRPDSRPAAEEQPADDLALELENELMGGLDENEPDAPQEGEAFTLHPAVPQEEQPVESGISEIEPVEPHLPQDVASAQAYAEPAREAEAEMSGFADSELDAALEAGRDQAFSADDEASVPAQPEFPQDGFGAPDASAPRQEGFGEGDGEVEPFVIREEDFAALDSDFTSPESAGDEVFADRAEPASLEAALSFASFQEAEAPQRQDVTAETDPEPLPASIFTAADAATATYRLAPELELPTGREDTAQAEEPAPLPESTDDSSGGAFGDWSLEHIFGGSDKPHVEELSAQADDPQEALPYAGAAELPPEVETVDVPEEAVAVADTLDIPDVPHREEVKPAAELDEIDELLAGAFGETGDLPEVSEANWKETEPAAIDAAPASSSEDERLDEFLAAGIAAGLGVAGTAANASRPAEATYPEDLNGDFTETYSRDWEHLPEQPVGAGLAPAPGIEPPVETERGRSGSRALLAAAVAGGVVILGGVTVFALTFNGGESSGPVLVKADNEPVKVQPEDPGGTVIPNQDNQVYKRVSGEEAGDAVPAQAELVSTAEEPLDLPGVTGSSGATPAVMEGGSDKREDRLDNSLEEAAAGETEVAALAPRRVRSLVVRPDGTMVPREMPEPQETASASAGEQSASAGGQSAAADGNAPDNAETAAVDTAGATETTDVPIPNSAPIPPSRPANIASTQQQPSGQASQAAQSNSAPTQVAAAEPQPVQPSAAASGWSVQIASQPSAQDAQQSYQELAQRYGNLLQGRGVNIVKADIAGKGTYYRVRIPSSSKDEAVRLCSQLKSAGGNCFVSQ
ncbi:SPOR domain-containing protein [Chelativorans sp. M5D2P16]|uniref:SPOR domain-containing protein n=1 Tax=Chelativorans sp. M5D2P16 TaxID=3095678 RepID=UPI002ACA33F5|nr:SPOR domain-containing protein [Chelativorans sp. M5D2P16]MDZ5697015.1 SPOR domain-containing protein [Chelativorans sp. M5D2P16]